MIFLEKFLEENTDVDTICKTENIKQLFELLQLDSKDEVDQYCSKYIKQCKEQMAIYRSTIIKDLLTYSSFEYEEDKRSVRTNIEFVSSNLDTYKKIIRICQRMMIVAANEYNKGVK